MEKLDQAQHQQKWYLDQREAQLLILDAIPDPQPQDIQLGQMPRQSTPLEIFSNQLIELFSDIYKYADYKCESTKQIISDINVLLRPSYTKEQIESEKEEIARHMGLAGAKEVKTLKFKKRIKKLYGLLREIQCMEAKENIVRVHFTYSVATCNEGFMVTLKGPHNIVEQAQLKLVASFKVEIKRQDECNFFQRQPYNNYELNVRGFKKDLEEFPNHGVYTFKQLEHSNKPLKIMKLPFDEAYLTQLELYS